VRENPHREQVWIATASLARSFHSSAEAGFGVRRVTGKSSHMVAILAACRQRRVPARTMTAQDVNGCVKPSEEVC
jgi:hypothetical protein